MDDKAEKVALFRYGLIAPLVLETLPRGELTRRAQEIAARLYDIPHSTRRQVSVDTLLDWTLRYRRNGLAALVSQTAPGSRTSPRRRAGTRRSHRTAQAREPASYRRRSAARVGRGQRAEPGRPVGFHALSFPARPRPHRTPTAARQSHRAQKVRSPVRQSDLAVRHALRPLGRAARAAASSRSSSRPRSTTPAASSRTPSSIPTRDWTPFWTACARPSPPAAFPPASTWTTPRSTAPRNWPASPPPSASSSSTRLPISPKAAARSNASSAPCANSSWPTSIPNVRSRSRN